VQVGELWVVFAYAKRCKTTWLINMGYRSTYVDTSPTLHFVLEGKGEQTAAKYDALFSREMYQSVKKGHMTATTFRYLRETFQNYKRLLVIKTLNDWDITVGHIQAEISELAATGFKPKMLIVDYMDLLRSRSEVASETQHQVNAARDLKRLVNQHDYACWSAWQAQRPKVGAHDTEHILSSSQVADAYGKVRIVDAFGSLNATDREMNEGTMRLFMESYRDAPVNQLYRIHNDLARMRMATSYEHMGRDTVGMRGAVG
jgi:replicative DNA helicase